MAFKVGDRVRVNFPEDPSDGYTGVVRGYRKRHPHVIVEFPPSWPHGHSANGVCPSRKGWWILEANLEIDTPPQMEASTLFTLEEITEYSAPARIP